MEQRRGIALILAAAAVCLLLAGIGAYTAYAILDADAFAGRAVATLRSDEVREEVGARVAKRVVEQHPELARGQSAIEEAAIAQVSEPAYAAGFWAAALRMHHALFSDANIKASLRVSESGGALRERLQQLPGWSQMPELADPSLLAVETGGREGLLRDLAPPARVLTVPLTLVLALAGAALLAVGIGHARDRRRAVWGAGVTVAMAAGLVAVGVTAAADFVLDQFDTGYGDAVVAQVWTAYVGDLRVWALALGAAGLVLAAAAGGPRLSLRPLLATPKVRGDRLIRATALLALAALAVTLPELVLHIGLLTLAGWLVYVAAGELVKVLAPPDSARRAARTYVCTATLLMLIVVVAVPATPT